jgi:hypothetical protein
VGVPRSPWDAFDALRRGCDAGKLDGCHEAARVVLQERVLGAVAAAPAPEGGAGSDGSSPVGGGAGAKTALPTPASDGSGATDSRMLAAFPTPTAAVTEARRLLLYGCEGGASTASAECCGVLAQGYVTRSLGPTLEALEACRVDDADAAVAEGGGGGSARVRGRAAAASTPSKCLAWLTRACDGEHVSSCTLLAKMHAAPDGYPAWGVARDVGKAREWDARAMRLAGVPQRHVDKLLRERYGRDGALV